MLAPICWFILFPSTLNIPKCSNSQSCTRAEVRSSSLSPGLSHRWKGPDHYVKQSPTASQEARAGTGARNWTPAPPIYWLLGHVQCTHCYSIEGLSEETRNLPANDLLNLIIKKTNKKNCYDLCSLLVSSSWPVHPLGSQMTWAVRCLVNSISSPCNNSSNTLDCWLDCWKFPPNALLSTAADGLDSSGTHQAEHLLHFNVSVKTANSGCGPGWSSCGLIQHGGSTQGRMRGLGLGTNSVRVRLIGPLHPTPTLREHRWHRIWPGSTCCRSEAPPPLTP